MLNIVITKLEQSPKVLDLTTGAETTVKISQDKYSFATIPEGVDEETFYKDALSEAASLVGSAKDQAVALLAYATSQSYQDGKVKAMASGNYLTSGLKAQIVQVMRGNQAFVDLSAKECFDRWTAGYIAKKPGAAKVLETAKALGENLDF